jgi:hypothetical protein
MLVLAGVLLPCYPLGAQEAATQSELTPQEVDLCFRETHLQRKAGQLESYDDFIETLQRCRLALQLKELRLGGESQEFPGSVDEWAASAGVPVSTPTETILPQIIETLYGDVIKGESINRALGATVTRFNQLVSQLEANSENENFWSTTGQAP